MMSELTVFHSALWTLSKAAIASENALWSYRSFYIIKHFDAGVPENLIALEAAWRAVGRSKCCQRGTILWTTSFISMPIFGLQSMPLFLFISITI